MKMTSEIPDHAAAVECVLEGFVQCCQLMIRSNVVPPFPHDVVGIEYRVEPAGEEDWKLPVGVIRDGWGDCEDLAMWTAAGLRESGEDPGARVVIARTGPGKLHALVERSDGTHEDPSADLRPGTRPAPSADVSGWHDGDDGDGGGFGQAGEGDYGDAMPDWGEPQAPAGYQYPGQGGDPQGGGMYNPLDPAQYAQAYANQQAAQQQASQQYYQQQQQQQRNDQYQQAQGYNADDGPTQGRGDNPGRGHFAQGEQTTKSRGSAAQTAWAKAHPGKYHAPKVISRSDGG